MMIDCSKSNAVFVHGVKVDNANNDEERLPAKYILHSTSIWSEGVRRKKAGSVERRQGGKGPVNLPACQPCCLLLL